MLSAQLELPALMKGMAPMFEPKAFAGAVKPRVCQYSFSRDWRIAIFDFIIRVIRKYSVCPVDLCKEFAMLEG